MPTKVAATSWLRRGRVLRLPAATPGAERDEVWALLPPLEVPARWPLRTHTAVQGERLDTLAARYLGDPALWWVLAEVNQRKDPWDVEPGDSVLVPDRRTVQLEVLADAR